MLFSYTIVDFYFYYNKGAVMQICTLLTRIQCKVSDTQVTVKASGPLVCNFFLMTTRKDVMVRCKVMRKSTRNE